MKWISDQGLVRINEGFGLVCCGEEAQSKTKLLIY